MPQSRNGLRGECSSEAFEYSALTVTLALCTDLGVPACLLTGSQGDHRTQRTVGTQLVTY